MYVYFVLYSTGVLSPTALWRTTWSCLYRHGLTKLTAVPELHCSGIFSIKEEPWTTAPCCRTDQCEVSHNYILSQAMLKLCLFGVPFILPLFYMFSNEIWIIDQAFQEYGVSHSDFFIPTWAKLCYWSTYFDWTKLILTVFPLNITVWKLWCSIYFEL